MISRGLTIGIALPIRFDPLGSALGQERFGPGIIIQESEPSNPSSVAAHPIFIAEGGARHVDDLRFFGAKGRDCRLRRTRAGFSFDGLGLDG
jgi:hypothetical protein